MLFGSVMVLSVYALDSVKNFEEYERIREIHGGDDEGFG